MFRIRHILVLLSACIALSCCTKEQGDPSRDNPPIWPDYTDITIPENIAPMNFGPKDDSAIKRMRVIVCSAEGKTLLRSKGKVTHFPVGRWHKALKVSSGSELSFHVDMKTDGGWIRYKPFKMHVSPDRIDYGLTYRLIPPGYQSFGHMGIYERNLSNFKERELIDTRMIESGCVNCHTENKTDPAQFSLHIRGSHSATALRHEDNIEYLNTKTDSTGGFFVYPYWHPSGKYIAYSVNNTRQSFYASADKFLEVYDEKSDIIIYSPEDHGVIRPAQTNRKDLFETWPAFSSDGNTLYFCASEPGRLPRDIKQMQYSLCSALFDPASGVVNGVVDTLLNAPVMGKSFSQPRPSYDGKYLLVTSTDFGTFPIWHEEADLWLYDLESGSFYPAGGINSDNTESFHNWSSNSKWAVVASRRDDGLYTKLYLAHLNSNGFFDKAFLLPQKNPSKYYSELIYSYNTPDFTSVKVPFNRHAFRKMILSDHRQSVQTK